jgi:hypothetical protein
LATHQTHQTHQTCCALVRSPLRYTNRKDWQAITPAMRAI